MFNKRQTENLALHIFVLSAVKNAKKNPSNKMQFPIQEILRTKPDLHVCLRVYLCMWHRLLNTFTQRIQLKTRLIFASFSNNTYYLRHKQILLCITTFYTINLNFCASNQQQQQRQLLQQLNFQ